MKVVVRFWNKNWRFTIFNKSIGFNQVLITNCDQIAFVVLSFNFGNIYNIVTRIFRYDLIYASKLIIFMILLKQIIMLINIITFNYIYIIKHEWEKERNNAYWGFCYMFIKYFIQLKYFRKKSLFLQYYTECFRPRFLWLKAFMAVRHI